MRTLVAVAAAAMLFSSPAQAQFLTYSSRASFESQLGMMVVDDYSNSGYQSFQSDAAMNAVRGETRYSSTTFLNWNLVPSGYYCAGCNGSYVMDFQTTSVSSGGLGVYGAGFDFFNSGSLLQGAFVTFGDGTTANIALPAATYSPRSFFGVTSGKLIAKINIGLTSGVAVGSSEDASFGQDNLTIGSIGNTTTVPEPSTVVLLAAGLAGLGFAGRARRSRA